MAGSSIKLGVDVTDFKRGMTDAQASVKSLDAAIKANEKSMQAYGKSESYASTQAGLLNSKLEEQKKIVQNAEKALKTMEANGVSKSSKAYQDMQRKMLEAKGAMADTTIQLNNLANGEQNAAKGADELASSVGGISRKMSLDQVISGINSVTNALEKAAGKAVELGKAIWTSISDSAEWADNTATQALILGMDVEEYQKYAKVFETYGEITVQEWRKAKQKVQKAINDPTKDQIEVLEALGIKTHESSAGKYGEIQTAARNYEEVFWEIGKTLREKVASGQLTQDMADVYAQALFGKGFDQLNPMFALGQEGFQAAVDEQKVVTEEYVQNLASYHDSQVKLLGDFETLKTQVIGSLAPALETAAKALDGLLTSIIDYLQTPEGQAALEKLGDAVSGLFGDLSKIDPEKVVQGFVDVFTKVTDGIQWLVDNKETAKGILGAIVAGWGVLTIGENVLKVIKLVDGIKGLTGSAAAEGAAAGASWGSAFASAVVKAAPWLIGLYELLHPGEAQDNSLVDKNGNMTAEGYYDGLIAQSMENPEYKKFLMELGGYYGADQLISVLTNENAASAIWNYLISGKAGYNTEGFVNQVLGPITGNYYQAGWQGVDFSEEELNEILQAIQPALTPTFIIPDDTAQTISEEIGTVKVNTELIVHKDHRGGDFDGFDTDVDGEEANGIWAVPFDGYLARLHKNERVVPAREVSSRSFSSNLYVESMIMNNGTDAEGLAASMAAAQRRTMAGFGS